MPFSPLRPLRNCVTAAACVLAGVLTTSSSVPAVAEAGTGPEPVLSHLELTHPTIHAVGAEHTGVPKSTRLELTLNVAAFVRVRVKDVDPSGLSRVLSRDLPAGASAITFNARIDGTKLPPGTYKVLVKAHNEAGSSKKVALRVRLRIVGENG